MIDGLYINKLSSTPLNAGVGDTQLTLLAKRKNVEIMSQSMVAGSAVWVIPADDKETMEFFFVHRGEIELVTDEGDIKLSPGESFYVEGLGQELIVRVNLDTTLLYITNSPMFDTVFGFQEDLLKLVEQINEKDDYTLNHCRRVMHYSTKLFEKLASECVGFSMDDIVVASLFHDVGKCFLPTEILKNHGELSLNDARLVYKHPRDSARLLKPHFGDKIADITMSHHERLDGSGYPMSLAGDDICFPARIVAVADVFDAMTSDRGYNEVKPFEIAAAELTRLSTQFDIKVTTVLLRLVEAGDIARKEENDDKA